MITQENINAIQQIIEIVNGLYVYEVILLSHCQAKDESIALFRDLDEAKSKLKEIDENNPDFTATIRKRKVIG